MVIEKSTNLNYIGRDLAQARDKGMKAKKQAELAQDSSGQLLSLSKHASRLIFGADKARKGGQVELHQAREHTDSAQEIIVEILGPDLAHSELAKAAGHAAGLLSGEVAFEGAKLPTVIARADRDLTELVDVLNQIEALSDTTLLRSTQVHENLGEIVDTNGPLDMAADNLRVFKRHI